MPDHFEELFADLRAATLPRVLPPGVDAARRTARRRRISRTVTAAAVAVTVAGGLAAAVPPLREGNRVAAAERLKGRLDTAKRAVDSQLPNVARDSFSQPVAGARPVTFHNLSAGTYNLGMACAGAGTVTVEARLVRGADDTAVLGGEVVSCDERPQATYLVLRLPLQGSIVITTAGDAAAVDDAGYAIDLRPDADTANAQPESATSESTWNAARAADVLAMTGRPFPSQVTTEQVLDATHFTGPGLKTEPGDYEFTLVCAGPGTLTLTIRTVSTRGGKIGDGATVLERQVACLDIDPRLDETDQLTLPKNFGFTLTVVPDQEASNRAGFAYHLRPR